MAFIETPRFPLEVNFGSALGPRYMTDVARLASGAEKRNQRWTYPLIEGSVRFTAKDADDWYDILELFHAAGGCLEGFRVKDASDWNSSGNQADNSEVGYDDCPIQNTVTGLFVGDGSTTTFQLHKRYTWGSTTRDRKILKPVSGTTVCGVNGSQTALFSVDTTTGIVTFNSAPGNGQAVTAGFQFDLPMRFGEDFRPVTLEEVVGSHVDIPLCELRNP